MKRITTIVFAFMALLPSAFSQNTGIGTTTPRAKLEIFGVFSGGATGGLFGSNNAGISIQRNWPTIGFNQYRDLITAGSQGKYMSTGYAAIQYLDPGTGILAFDMMQTGTVNTFTPGGVRAITIANNGNTAFRDSYTGGSLVVGRGDGYEGTAVFQGPAYSSHFNYSPGENTYMRGGQDGANLYINREANGPVLIGTTFAKLGINNPGVNPFFTIEILHNNVEYAFSLVDAINKKWSMQTDFSTGPVHGDGCSLRLIYQNSPRTSIYFGDGEFYYFSDRRLKEDIQPLNEILPKLGKLRPVRYEMIRNNPEHRKSLGFLAQDVKNIFPQLVRQITDHNRTGTPINDALVMDYSGFSVIAIKALQEQAKELQALEKEKQELLHRLEELEKQQD